MSSVSMTYIKYRAGGNASWNSDVSNITAPLIAGWPSGSTLYGTLYRLSVTVSSGYTVTKLTFNIPQIRSYSSVSANVYAAVYNHDPSDEFSGQSASTNYISTGYTSTSINSSSPNNLKVTVSGLSIGSSGTYYVFISSTAPSSASPYMYLALQSTQLSCSATDTKNLTPATNITVSSTLYMNSQATISWTPYTSGYTYKVAYKFTGQSSVTNIVSSTSSSSCTWTPPTSLGSNIPTTTSGTVTIYVYSYEGGTQVGSTCSAEFSLSLPTSGREPVCSSGWASSNYTAVVNHCVAGYSTINVTIDSSKVSGSYGATIASIVASCNSQTRTDSGSLGTALQGNNIVSVVATDSRGYTTTYTNTIVGEQYSSPSFTSITLIRCDVSGTESTDGTYYAVTPVVSYTDFSGDNTLTIQTRYKLLDGGTYGSYENLTNNTKGVAGGGNITTASSYLIEISTYDSIVTSSNRVVQTRILTNTSVAATLNLAPNGISAAFFGLANNTAVKKLRVHGEVSSETMTIDSPLPVTSGGTGGATPAAARLNLGAVSAEATGSVTPPSQFTLSIEEGGTGATTVAAAQTNLGILDFDVRDQLVPTANISAGSGTQMSVQANYLYYSKSKDGRFFSLHGVLSVGGGSQSSGWSGFIITGLGLQPSAQKNVPSAGFLMQGSKILANYDYVNYNVLANGDVRLNYYQYGDGSSTSYHLNFYGNLVQIK